MALAPGIIPSTESKLFEILSGFDKFESTCAAVGLFELCGKDWSHKFEIVKAINPDVMKNLLSMWSDPKFNDEDGT